MAGNDDQTLLVSELCALISRCCIENKRAQTRVMPSVKVFLAREAARGDAERRLVRGNAENGLLLSSVPKGSGQGERLGRSRGGGGGRYLPIGEVKEDGSMGSECRVPDTAVSLARAAESSSSFGSPRRVHGRAIYSEKNVLVSVIAVTSFLMCQEDLTTSWNEYTRTGFPKYVILHRGGVESEGEDCVAVRPQEPFREHALNEMVRSGTEDVGSACSTKAE